MSFKKKLPFAIAMVILMSSCYWVGFSRGFWQSVVMVVSFAAEVVVFSLYDKKSSAETEE